MHENRKNSLDPARNECLTIECRRRLNVLKAMTSDTLMRPLTSAWSVSVRWFACGSGHHGVQRQAQPNHQDQKE